MVTVMIQKTHLMMITIIQKIHRMATVMIQKTHLMIIPMMNSNQLMSIVLIHRIKQNRNQTKDLPL
jgi:hypothetical protein